jgi:DNA modification methylase
LEIAVGNLVLWSRHRVLCGDSTSIDDFEKLMAGEKAELCFTSPPYADQREYNGENDLSTQHLATFIRTGSHLCNYFAVNLGYSRKDGEVNPYWDDYIKEAKENGLKLLSWNVWHKGECGSIGNQTAMFGISHEWIFVFGADRKQLNMTVPNKSAGGLANHTGNRQSDGTIKAPKHRIVADFSQLKTVYECTAQKARDEIDHPARFPVVLPEGYIEAMTDIGQIVYEPFCGSGTTLIAAEKTGRRCFVSEIDPRYVDVILSRYIKYSGKMVIREDGEQWAA